MSAAPRPRAVAGLFVGLATLDVVHRVDRPPGRDEKVTALRTDVAAGGPATVAAITFAALGGRATLLSVAGDDPTGRLLAEDVTASGVVLLDRARPGTRAAPSSAVVVDGTGDRSVVSGARSAPAPDPLAPDDAEALVADVEVVLVDGHHPALAVPVASAAARRGVPVVLDGGSHKPAIDELLPHTSAAVFSGTFAFPGGAAPGRTTTALGPSFVAVTHGGAPVRWWTATESGEVPVPAASARDTLGAGDVFHGAFAFALAAGAEPVAALGSAVAVAGVRVEHVGPRAWLADPRLGRLAAGVGP